MNQVIGDNVQITIINIQGLRAIQKNLKSLAATAPQNIPVHRREIYENNAKWYQIQFLF